MHLHLQEAYDCHLPMHNPDGSTQPACSCQDCRDSCPVVNTSAPEPGAWLILGTVANPSLLYTRIAAPRHRHACRIHSTPLHSSTLHCALRFDCRTGRLRVHHVLRVLAARLGADHVRAHAPILAVRLARSMEPQCRRRRRRRSFRRALPAPEAEKLRVAVAAANKPSDFSAPRLLAFALRTHLLLCRCARAPHVRLHIHIHIHRMRTLNSFSCSFICII